jgi:hypothetical protein
MTRIASRAQRKGPTTLTAEDAGVADQPYKLSEFILGGGE